MAEQKLPKRVYVAYEDCGGGESFLSAQDNIEYFNGEPLNSKIGVYELVSQGDIEVSVTFKEDK